MDRYLITWVETSHLQAEVTAERLAELLSCGVDDLDEDDDLTQGLEDALAEIEEEFDTGHFTRENIKVIKVDHGS